MAQSIRWVVMTALGNWVDPEVNRNLAMLSGPVASNARSAAEPPGVCSRLAKLTRVRPGTSPRTLISGVSAGNTASIARW